MSHWAYLTANFEFYNKQLKDPRLLDEAIKAEAPRGSEGGIYGGFHEEESDGFYYRSPMQMDTGRTIPAPRNDHRDTSIREKYGHAIIFSYCGSLRDFGNSPLDLTHVVAWFRTVMDWLDKNGDLKMASMIFEYDDMDDKERKCLIINRPSFKAYATTITNQILHKEENDDKE